MSPAKPGRFKEQTYVEALGAACPPLAQARTFVQILEHHEAAALDPRLTAAEASELRWFATELRRDHDAVLAAPGATGRRKAR